MFYRKEECSRVQNFSSSSRAYLSPSKKGQADLRHCSGFIFYYPEGGKALCLTSSYTHFKEKSRLFSLFSTLHFKHQNPLFCDCENKSNPKEIPFSLDHEN
jgi:hypothetical protein